MGAALVAAHFTEVAALQRTVTVLGEQLGSCPGAGGRLMEVVGALAAGYAQALRDRTLAEQERISASAFAARVAAEQARWNSEARFAAVFAESVIGIGVGDIDGTILEVNRALCEMLGYSAEEFQASPDLGVHPPRRHPGGVGAGQEPDVRGDRQRAVRKGVLPQGRRRDLDPPGALVGPRPAGPAAVRRGDGGEHHRTPPPADPAGPPGDARPAHRTAQPDPVLRPTGRRTRRPSGPDRAVGVCYLDLDDFKAVNDTLGHDTGDALLRAVAQRLGDELGREGHLVARMGGDEFVVLVEHSTGVEQLERVAQTALDTVRRPVVVDGHPIVVSASVGIVRHTDDDTAGAAALMQAADTTMYWAKADGRDRYALFDAERHHVDVSRFALSARMPEALAHGEFVVEYQPLVRLQDQQTTGVEALVRWQLPGR